MSTQNVPAHIAARIAERQKNKQSTLASAVLATTGTSAPRISLRAGRFRLVESGIETTVGVNLDVIIVGVNPKVSKVFYAGAWDPNAESNGPACFSNDGTKPDARVESPVSNNCTTCPHNVLGSKVLPSGAKSKMCADQRHIAVVAAADPSKVYSLTVPVSGMKALREYFTELANYGIGPEEAITELGFDENASYPKLIFKHKGYVPEKAMGTVDLLLEDDATKIAIRVLDPTNATPKLEGNATPQMAAPKATPEDDEAAAYEQPAIVATTKEEKPKVEAVKSSDELSAKLDSLFDE